MKKTMLHVSLALVAIFGITLVGCTQVSGTDQIIDVGGSSGNHENNNGDCSRYIDLAIIKTLETHQVDISELSKIVLNAFNQTMASTTAGRVTVTSSSISEIRGVHINTKNKFEKSKRFGRSGREYQGRVDGLTGNKGRSVDVEEKETVELFEFVISDKVSGEWFVLASNDLRIGHILTITQESFEDSDNELAVFLHDSLNEYIEAIIFEYNDITDDDAEATLNTLFEANMPGVARGVAPPDDPVDTDNWKYTGYSSNMEIQRGPLLKTQWGQGTKGYTNTGYAYNNYIKYHYRDHQDGDLYVTGCGATAIAQIIAYHNYINPTVSSIAKMAPEFTDATSSTMNMGTWNKIYNLSLINNISTITNSSSSAEKGQVAALMYHVFWEINSTPKIKENEVTKVKTGFTTAPRSAFAPAFRNFGYIIEYEGTATSLSGTSSSFSIQSHTNLDTIRNSINYSRPILICGFNSSNNGHAWVIDGYGSVSWIEEYYKHKISGETYTRRVALNNVLMVHCNLGWNGKNYGYNGWYIYGIFDAIANINHLNMPDIKAGDRNYSSGTWLVIPRRP